MSIYKNLFVDNKYTKIYYSIINNAKEKHRIKYTSDHDQYVYYELHHIIPVSLDNTLSDLKTFPDNGVLLTPKEHFICHMLLTKMVIDPLPKLKMIYALQQMCKISANQGRRITSGQYAYARKIYMKLLSLDYDQRYGKAMAKNIKKKMSISRQGERNGMYGKTHRDESLKIMKLKASKRSAKNKGKSNIEIFGTIKSKEISNKISKSNEDLYSKRRGSTYEELYGEEKAQEIKKKLSSKSKGRKLGPSKLRGTTHKKESIEKMKQNALNRPKTQCPHCHRFLDPGNFKQFHGENCKHRKI